MLNDTKRWIRSEAVVFRKTKESYGGLSNMAGGYPLKVAGESLRTSEALYQACRFPNAPDVQYAIIEQTSPMVAKWVSRKHRSTLCRPDWNEIQVDVMRWCLRVKAAQHHETFGELLLSTGSTAIVEESRRDAFWGAVPQPDGDLLGVNALGLLLVEIRGELGRGAVHATPPGVPNFKLFGKSLT